MERAGRGKKNTARGEERRAGRQKDLRRVIEIISERAWGLILRICILNNKSEGRFLVAGETKNRPSVPGHDEYSRGRKLAGDSGAAAQPVWDKSFKEKRI